MTTAEAIHNKVIQLPPNAQEEILEAVELIEERYATSSNSNGSSESEHPLSLTAALAKDLGVTDFAERHDYFAHGKLED